MKARVKATDKIIEVMCVMGAEGMAVWEDISGVSTCANQYTAEELEFLDFPTETRATYNPDYWTRLEHQYAGMAMQGILAHEGTEFRNYLLQEAIDIAHALVEKYKKEEK